MVVDNKTTPNYFRIDFREDNTFKEVLKKALQTAEEEGLNQSNDSIYQIYLQNIVNGEYYFDNNTNCLNITCDFDNEGNVGSFSIELPISDEVLIDILSNSIKRFNKLKVALESLK